MNIFDQLSLAGLVPVIKVEDAADAVPLCKALSDGGLPVAEITFRTDAAEESIRRVHAELPDVMLGAGTVLTVDQVKRAVAAGAAYIVSPGLNPTVVGYCVENDIPVLPGCANPSDIEVALGFGLKIVKFFPAEALGGLKLIKAMSAPYGGISFVPTGGINEKNFLEYLAFNKVKAIGGSWMVPGDAVKEKDWDRIRGLAQSAVQKMLGFELLHIGINSGTPEQAEKDAKKIALLTGLPMREHGPISYFVGEEYELMKNANRGTHGHIAIATNSVERAVWHLERRGFEFEPAGPGPRYIKGEIGGFGIHLQQK